VAREILRQRFDYIFFTGSPSIGQSVMKAAAEHLTPITLELGGKSPCIVDHTARLDIAARRIAWGKFWNAGQTCLAPDYLLVERSVKEALVTQLRTVLSQFYGSEPKDSPDYARIIDKRHFERLVRLIEPSQVIHGGDFDAHKRYIAPTLMDHISLEDPVMCEEIFGPILPILEYDRLEEAVNIIHHFPDPLALYLFSEDSETRRRIISEVPYGSGCINDTLSQMLNPGLPFGGRGRSGMGQYHGKFAFDTFSHTKGVITRSGWLDTHFRYPPYRMPLGFLRKLMKFTGQ
jgi:aldehyde dehydrogenase (NAD+)